MKQAFFILSLLLVSTFTFAQFGSPIRITTNIDAYEGTRTAFSTDYDGDGDLDLVHGTAFSGHIFLTENIDGIDNFSDPIIIATPSSFSIGKIDIADFDLDGDDDFIAFRDDVIKVYYNTRKKELHPESVVIETPPTSDMFVVDINQDGRKDILILNEDHGIDWYQNNEEGFSELQVLTSLDFLYSPQFLDFDNDEDLDIIFYNYPAENFGVVINDNNIFEESIVLVEESEFFTAYIVEDYDSDGDLDIFTDSNNQGHIFKYENLGVGNGFGEKTPVTPDENVYYSKPYFSDYDQDGDIDFLALSGTSLTLFENTDGNFVQSTEIYQMGGPIHELIEADFDGDGVLDLVTAISGTTAGYWQFFLFRGKDVLSYYNPVDLSSGTGNVQHLLEEDLNDDGIPEIIKSSYSHKGNWAQFNGTAHKLKKPHTLPVESYLRTVQQADFDGDSYDDLLVLGDKVEWLRRTGVEIEYENSVVLASGSFTSALAGDFDSDGDSDVLYHDGGGSADDNGIYLMSNDGTGNFSDPFKLSEFSFQHESIFSIDIDTDGDLDIVATKSYSDIVVFLNDGAGIFTEEILYNINGLYYIFLEDIDNDGIKDIFLAEDGSDDLSWIKLNGDGTTGSKLPVSMVDNAYQTSLADIDSDGDIDVYVKVNDGGEFSWFWCENFNDGIFTDPVALLGDVRHVVLFSDVNRDGSTDIIYHNNSDKALYSQENYNNYPSITGNTFFDANEDGVQNDSEPALNLQSIGLEPLSLFTYTSNQGDYFFAAAEGDYQVVCHPFEDYAMTTPQSVGVTVGAEDQVVNFGVTAVNILLEGEAVLTSAPTRCGFSVPFWLDYQNTGTIPANGVISLPLDPLVTFISSEPMPDSIISGTVYWSFEELYPTQSGQISMMLQMPSVEFIGEEIEMATTLNLTSITGSQTYASKDVFTSIINCSYDPNDKQVKPNFPGYENYTEFGDTLDYNVRFQNTGTDTAFTIRIEDYLDPDLDWSTLRIIGASHDYTATLDMDAGRLLFTFDNILLPDSTENEPLSHGYLRYKIQHKDGLNEGTYIDNTANIYFDFNPPIITNTVYSLLTTNFPLLFDVKSPACHGESTGSITAVFENPYYIDYQWNTGHNGAEYSNLSANDYNLTVTTIEGNLIDTTFTLLSSDTLFFEEYVVTDISCNTEGAVEIEILGGSPPYNFAWSNSTFETTLDGIFSEGTYNLNVTDIRRCSIEKSFEIAAADDALVFTTSSQAANMGISNGSASVDVSNGIAPYTYDWSHSNTAEEATAQNLAGGDYSVTVTDSNGCQIIAEITVDNLSSIFNTSARDYFIVYPNPSFGDINIRFLNNSFAKMNLSVTDLLGRDVYQAFDLDGNVEEMQIALSSGQYFIRLYNEEFSVRQLVLVR